MRCSTPEVVMADTLSKVAFFRFWKIAAENEVDVPWALVAWLKDCLLDDGLGDKLVKSLVRLVAVLGVRS